MREKNSRAAATPKLTATRAQLARWQDAIRWRRRVDAALAGSGLRFNEWLVLAATRRLVRETGDDVSQNQVAVRLEMSRMSVTNAMRSLDHLGLVSRGEAMRGPAWRVFVTREGTRFLSEHAASIEAASAEW